MTGCPIGFTCPSIDDAISDAEKAADFLDNAYTHIRELLGKCGSLEVLRDQNAALRSWGEEMQSERDDLQEEIDKLQEREVELEFEIERLTKLLDENDIESGLEGG